MSVTAPFTAPIATLVNTFIPSNKFQLAIQLSSNAVVLVENGYIDAVLPFQAGLGEVYNCASNKVVVEYILVLNLNTQLVFVKYVEGECLIPHGVFPALLARH